MAPSCYDAAASMLLCAEEHSSILWYDEEEEELEAVGRRRGRSPGYGDDFGADLFPPQSEECVAGLVERERDHMPGPCYGDRLRGGGGCLCVRREAVDWIWKAYTHHRFRPLTAYLAVNYLDRFLSLSEVPDCKDWMTQLLAVACVSLAAKMEETAVPQCLDLQEVGDARYVFEAKTVQRMELLVLTTLNWRMHAVTPFSYVDYFLNKLNNGGSTAPRSCWLLQSAELILRAARGIQYRRNGHGCRFNICRGKRVHGPSIITPFRTCSCELTNTVCARAVAFVARQEPAASGSGRPRSPPRLQPPWPETWTTRTASRTPAALT
uniref:Cyclin-like domain-containing protein n=1 Tax=Zea mays TaxID=4577 RepID=C0PLS7_MAIZE|nr:unknown [Zea mays]